MFLNKRWTEKKCLIFFTPTHAFEKWIEIHTKLMLSCTSMLNHEKEFENRFQTGKLSKGVNYECEWAFGREINEKNWWEGTYRKKQTVQSKN